MNPTAPVIVAAGRSPIGTAGGGLATVPAEQLAAAVLTAVTVGLAGKLAPELDSLVPDDVILGNCTGPGGNLARVATLAAGLGTSVPGLTVDRQCGSGLAAVGLAGQAVRAGEARLILAGGVESASTAPLRAHRPRTPAEQPRPYQRAPFAPPGYPDPEMGAAADALAAAAGISRPRQDAYASASHAKALAARAAGRFAAELVPVAGLHHDQRARHLPVRRLAKLPPAFVTPDGAGAGTVTAGNSSPVSDGAAVVAVVPTAVRGTAPGLRLVANAVLGCDPALPGRGPVPAVRQVLALARVKLAEVAAIEIVEAFAGQVLAVTDELGLDPLGADAGRVCADGGALALGHPWGASGAVSVVRLFSQLVHGGAPAGTLGLATVASAGGLGIATLFEVIR